MSVIDEKIRKYAVRGIEECPGDEFYAQIIALLDKRQTMTNPLGKSIERRMEEYKGRGPFVHNFTDAIRIAQEGDIIIYSIGRYKVFTNKEEVYGYMDSEYSRRMQAEPADHYHIITENDSRNLVVVCKDVTIDDLIKIIECLIKHFKKYALTQDKILVSPVGKKTYNIIITSMVGTQSTVFSLVNEFREDLSDENPQLASKIYNHKAKTDVQTDKKYWEWFISRIKMSSDLSHKLDEMSTKPIYITQNITQNISIKDIHGSVINIAGMNMGAPKTHTVQSWVAANPPKKNINPQKYHSQFAEETGSELTFFEFNQRMKTMGFCTSRKHGGRFYTKN